MGLNPKKEATDTGGKQWLDPSILPADVPMEPANAPFKAGKYIEAFEKELQEHFSGEGYEHLSRILLLAHSQSASGKGRERHAKGPTGFKPWDRQPIMEIGRMVGPGYAAGQVAKKVQEAVTMTGNRNFSGAKAEALGAIVYAAALYKLLEEME